MRTKIKTIFIAAFGLSALILFAPNGELQTKVETAGQHFKSIKVLNDMPADQLGKVMNMMSASLGVECKFCHASNDGDFEKEGFEHKDTARKMISMMFELNKKHFNGRPEINCNTCHHGISHPQPSFPLTAGTPPLPRPAQPDKKPTADEIVAKFETALGGRSKLEKITSRMMKATRVEPDGKTTEPETKWFKVNRYYAETLYGTTLVTEGYDGTKGWKAGNKAAIYMKPDEAEQLKREAELFSPANLKVVYPKMEYRAVDRIDGREVYFILATTAGNVRERLYFDVASGLLVRRSAATPTIFGNYIYQVDYADYKAFNGVKIPTTVRYSMPNISWMLKVNSVKNNVAIDDAKFIAPAPAKNTTGGF
jgi:hypothetical protein